jgi:hypothetical protein
MDNGLFIPVLSVFEQFKKFYKILYDIDLSFTIQDMTKQMFL